MIELKEELGSDIIDILIQNRLDTAVEVLTAGLEKLNEVKELDEDKVKEILEILKNQFEEEE